MRYFANPVGSDRVRTLMSQGVLGFIDTPRQRNPCPPDALWIADNGCFSDRWDAAHWYRWLSGRDLLARQDRCLFAVVPDVVADAEATLLRWRTYSSQVRALGYAPAFVLQDGVESHPVPWAEVGAIFVGGSDAFKLSEQARELVAEAKRRGLYVHVGRVNSRKRWQLFESWGADSCDGTFLRFDPRGNVDRILRVWWQQQPPCPFVRSDPRSA